MRAGGADGRAARARTGKWIRFLPVSYDDVEREDGMTAEAERLAQPRKPAKRKLRNYLLDARFQLKYTGMVVFVTVAVAAVLGHFAYRYSKGQTEQLTMQMLAQREDLDEQAMREIEAQAQAEDQRVLYSILGGIALLALALGLTGIVVTHKVVGPAYKLKRLLREVADGHIKVEGGLRKGDELQDVFAAFREMVESLRARQREEIEELSRIVESLRKTEGVSEEAVARLETLREQMEKMLA